MKWVYGKTGELWDGTDTFVEKEVPDVEALPLAALWRAKGHVVTVSSRSRLDGARGGRDRVDGLSLPPICWRAA